MRWDEVLSAIHAALEDESEITDVVGVGNIRTAGAREFVVPSLEVTVLSDDVTELWAPSDVQFDVFTRTMADLVTVERALRNLFDREGFVAIEGLPMWSFYLDGGPLEGPSLNVEGGVFARALRFRFAPVRERLIQGRS